MTKTKKTWKSVRRSWTTEEVKSWNLSQHFWIYLKAIISGLSFIFHNKNKTQKERKLNEWIYSIQNWRLWGWLQWDQIEIENIEVFDGEIYLREQEIFRHDFWLDTKKFLISFFFFILLGRTMNIKQQVKKLQNKRKMKKRNFFLLFFTCFLFCVSPCKIAVKQRRQHAKTYNN